MLHSIKTTALIAIAMICASSVWGQVNTEGTHRSAVTNAEEGAAVAQIGDTKYASIQAAVDAATEEQTIMLISDVSLSTYLNIPVSANITLDLNGHAITAASYGVVNRGTLVLKDSQTGGSITAKYAIRVMSNSVTTIESGTYSSVEGAVTLHTSVNATVNINGGTFTASDNAVISSNGTTREGEPNTVNITGGTFNGGIVTSGYVACGIYSPWKDVFNISGGTFNITNGAGIVARAGNINITGGEFNCTGNAIGKVGDNSVVVPCSAIVYDSQANYPGMTDDSNIAITGGTFTVNGESVEAVTLVKKEGETAQRIQISSGETTSPVFSTAVDADFCSEGFYPTQNSDGTYGVKKEFMVYDDKPLTLATTDVIENTKASYTREGLAGLEWGTICLPFTLKSTDDLKLYEVKDIDGDKLNLTAVEEAEPGTPLIFHKTAANASVTFMTENATVKGAAPSEKGALRGTYEPKKVTTGLENIYFINSNAFHQAKASLTVPAYRAYINYTGTSAKSSTLFINVSDNAGETEGIETVIINTTTTGYYTNDGVRHSSPQRGMNIIHMANGKTVKMMVK